MKPKTKRQLDALFCLGLITAALSIGRAVSITKKTLTEDATCTLITVLVDDPFNAERMTGNMIPSYYFSGFESKLGIIFACGPAVRQFFQYRKRTNSSLPTRQRQYPNQDFEKVRYRVNLRDIFWYRQAHMIGGVVYDAHRMFQSRSQPPPGAIERNSESTEKVNTSVLDIWERRIKTVFGTRKKSKPVSYAKRPGSTQMH